MHQCVEHIGRTHLSTEIIEKSEHHEQTYHALIALKYSIFLFDRCDLHLCLGRLIIINYHCVSYFN